MPQRIVQDDIKPLRSTHSTQLAYFIVPTKKEKKKGYHKRKKEKNTSERMDAWR